MGVININCVYPRKYGLPQNPSPHIFPENSFPRTAVLPFDNQPPSNFIATLFPKYKPSYPTILIVSSRSVPEHLFGMHSKNFMRSSLVSSSLLMGDACTIIFIPTHQSSRDSQTGCLLDGIPLLPRARYSPSRRHPDVSKSSVLTAAFPWLLEASLTHGFFCVISESDPNGFPHQ